MKINYSFLLPPLLIISALFGCQKEQPQNTISPKNTAPKNIILLIGDGMGLTQISATFYYQSNTPSFTRFKNIGFIRTSSASHKITDSAAGATAFSCGTKTYNAAVGVNADTLVQPTILELLGNEQGKKTGVVATSSITHATPASFYAHVPFRSMGEQIATFMPPSNIDFFAGGGLQFFSQRTDNANYLDSLKKYNFEIHTEALPDINTVSANKKYACLLADDGMDPVALGRGDFLPKATQAALKNLSGTSNGFFLLVEGSQIDWGGHANDAEYIITEMQDFDKTIHVVMDYAEQNPNTLVIVTADHETGGFALSAAEKTDSNGMSYRDYNELTGTFSTGGHTSTLIPVFAYGPGAEQFQGIYENTGIFDRIRALTNL